MATELPTPEEIAELRRIYEGLLLEGHHTDSCAAFMGSWPCDCDLPALLDALPSLLDAAERVRELEKNLREARGWLKVYNPHGDA